MRTMNFSKFISWLKETAFVLGALLCFALAILLVLVDEFLRQR